MSMTQLSKRNEVPKKFLEHIMLDLKKQEWVESSPGRHGGYVLAISPDGLN
jgi:DNA-binding IscR family transcriptional regulator